MNLAFHMPTQVFQGLHCLRENAGRLRSLGDRVLLVTGKHSAKASGVLTDLLPLLEEQGIAWEIFDRVEPNPSLATVEAGGKLARGFGARWVLGIGGGSPLDAAKAVAALAVNPVDPRRLFEGPLLERPLPVVAIPTTAGTGSEVTPYSILTDWEGENKRNYRSDDAFPVMAFLDGRYTQALPRKVTVHTAVDAFSHAAEGYLSRRANPLSDAMALEAIAHLGRVFPKLAREEELDADDRDRLLYGSMAAGITIAQTGTSLVHALGYPLTIYRDLPHGQANGLLMGEYFRFVQDSVPEKLAKLLATLGVNSLEEAALLMRKLIPLEESFNETELGRYARHALQAKSIANTPVIPDEGQLYDVLCRSLLP